MTVPERIVLATKICKLYETDEYTIESCCEKVGLNYDTFYNWITESKSGYLKEIKDLYKKAQDTKRKLNNKKLVRLARTALQKKLSFYEWVETTTETIGDKIVKIKTVNRFIIPTPTDIALALNNLDDDFNPEVSPLANNWTQQATIYGMPENAI